MGQRSQLHSLLKNLLGASRVYFQPPPTLALKYPCIVYKRDRINTDFATNNPYRLEKRYQVTVIYSDPDYDLSDKIAALPMCTFDRAFTADNLHHDVFNLFY